MKKAFKIHLQTWREWILVLVTMIVAGLICSSSQDSPQNTVRDKVLNLNQNPENIEEILNIDLPNIVNIEGSGEIYFPDTILLEGDSYTYKLEFEKPLSDTLISKLKEQCILDSCHWVNLGDTCIYHERTPYYNSYYYLDCYLYKTGINVVLSEEPEVYPRDYGSGGVLGVVIIFYSLFFGGLTILIVWGVILAYRRYKSRDE